MKLFVFAVALLTFTARASGECSSSKQLTFADGSVACMDQFEPLVIGGEGRNIAAQAGAARTHAYATTASDSKCVVSSGWAWDGANDDARAIKFCEEAANQKSGRSDCRCVSLIPVSGKVEMNQKAFVSFLFRHSYEVIEQFRARGPIPVSRLDALKKGLEDKEQEHYQRLANMQTPRKGAAVASNANDASAATQPTEGVRSTRSQDAAEFAQEKKDWGIAPTSTQRTGRLHAPTPREVPGAKTVTTVELRNLLDDPVPPVLIDVLDGPPHGTIRGARWIPDAGGGVFGRAESLRLEAALDRLTNKNKNKAIVFFCFNAECWLSYNASLRAIELGYKNVLWFRGGIAAWRDAAFAGESMVRTEAESW